jgi:hypothetical protein
VDNLSASFKNEFNELLLGLSETEIEQFAYFVGQTLRKRNLRAYNIANILCHFQLMLPLKKTRSIGVQTVITSNIASIKRRSLWAQFKSKPTKRVEYDSSMVQIQATSQEVNKRLTAFLEHKRKENNLSNQREFMDCIEQNGSESMKSSSI